MANDTEKSKTPEDKAPEKGSPEWYAEEVQIRVFRDGERYKDDVFVGVNGKGYLIKRGEDVMVPRFVAEIINQSLDEDANAASKSERLQADFTASSAALGIN